MWCEAGHVTHQNLGTQFTHKADFVDKFEQPFATFRVRAPATAIRI
jgi:hypothetical protein